MAIRFQKATHRFDKNIGVVEVFDNDEFLAVIYPEERGIKIISKFMREDPTMDRSIGNAPALIVPFARFA